MAKVGISSLANSTTRPIEEFSSGSAIAKHTRKIEKMKSTSSYKGRKEERKKYKKPSKITNSSKASSKQVFSFSGDRVNSKITPIQDKNIKFNLNMNYGSSYGNTAKYFDRLYSVYPTMELDNLCQYVFIIRPDLNILKKDGTGLIEISKAKMNSGHCQNLSPHNDQLFRYMLKKYPTMLKSLTSSLSGSHDFIPFLVGRTESLQLADFSIKDYKMNQPYTNYNLPYASHGLESTTGGEFEISFRDDADLRIHKLFQTWIYYIDGVTRNKFAPKHDYIKYNKIDYATSIYCITCKADAETIIHWSKYTGAFPITAPNSDLSFNLRGTPSSKLSIPFHYFRQESLDPYILVDFNKNAHVTKPNKQGYIPIYRSKTLNNIGLKDPRTSAQKKIHNNLSGSEVLFRKGYPIALGSGNGLVGCPYIYKDSNNDYKLRWKKTKDLSPK